MGVHKQVIWYSIALAVLLALVKWLQLSYFFINFSVEIYMGMIALLFTGLGIWLALKLMRPKPILVSVGAGFIFNEALMKELRISSRELEVLQLIAEGLSNQQIADRLFLSLPTVKTHAANLFLKMEVSRRTQAIEKAKRLGLIP